MLKGDGSARSAVSSSINSSANNSHRSSVAIDVDSYPENRKTLVDAVTSERSLSYLTESSAMFGNASLMTHNWQQQQLASPTRQESSNRWRDKYVLKFSGWKNSNPDHGLPPSLLSSNQKQLPQRSPLHYSNDADKAVTWTSHKSSGANPSNSIREDNELPMDGNNM